MNDVSKILGTIVLSSLIGYAAYHFGYAILVTLMGLSPIIPQTLAVLIAVGSFFVILELWFK